MQAGREAEASALVARLESRTPREYQVDNLAYIEAAAGRIDEAFRLLDQAIRERSTNLLWIAVDARAEPLRQDPRFHQVLRRIGLER